MKSRLILFLHLVILWVSLIFIKLVYLQVMRCQHYRKEAAAQQETILHLAPRRGIIYDRNGERLAVSVETESLIVNPQILKNPVDTLSKFARVLHLDLYTLCKSFNEKKEKNKKFFFVKRKLSPHEKRDILKLHIDGLNFCKGKERKECEWHGDIEKHFYEAGIYFQKEFKRVYPKGHLASHIIGISNIDEKGIEGLELYYDELLRENPFSIQVFKDARGNMFPLERPPDKKEETHLVLTIDMIIQHIAEKELEKAFHSFHAYKGCVIIMDPRNGEILALAIRPSFDPNRINDFPEENRKNFSITDIYEPGSTFKVITLASLLEQGKFSPGELVNCGNGCTYIHGIRISDHHPYRYLTALQVIEKSSNVGVIKLSEKLSEEALYETIKRFGFKERTGIDLPGEVLSPYIRDPSQWSKISKAIISIGQEIAVTPIQMLAAYAAIAHKGVMRQPHVAKGRLDSEGHFIPFKGFYQKQVIPEKTAKMITSILENAVLHGTGQKARISGYPIAGKTGTAQKFDQSLKAYSTDNFVASFIGYAPADDPRIVCLVILDIPKGKKFYGGDVAAPVFSKIVEQTLLYLKIPPRNRIFPSKKQNEPYDLKYSNKATSPPFSWDKALLIKDQGVLQAQFIPFMELRKRSKTLASGEKRDRMPDLYGRSLRDAMLLLSSIGLRVRTIGNGYVLHQYPEAGMTLHENDICILELTNDGRQFESIIFKEGRNH